MPIATRKASVPPGAPGLTPPVILGKSAIPFIGLSSGSVAANGAISGITALPVAYAAAYCWFPANALATAIPAGWYYCTFASTIAGTAYLNTYTGGTPSIPASPTPVADGKGAFTGDLGEEFGPTITVPANAMGANGALRISYASRQNNSAGLRTQRIRYSGNAGTVFVSAGSTTVALESGILNIQNRGVANSQVAWAAGGTAGSWNAGIYNFQDSAVDTTAATTVVLSMQRNTATDNYVIEQYTVELLSDGT